MGWYQCSCGFITEATPRLGRSIVSVSHLHRAARVDGTSSIARMEEIPDPALEGETACVQRSRATDEASFLVSTLSARARPSVASCPEHRAA